MKKFLLLFALIGISLITKAQTAVPMPADVATLVNTGTVNLTQKVINPASTITVQLNVTKNTGTAAGGAKLYGSLDGVNYTLATTATDTLAITNVASQSKFWVLTTNPYTYYRVVVKGSAGATQNCTPVSYIKAGKPQ